MPLVVARSEDAVVELVVANVFDLSLVIVEVAEGVDLLFFPRRDVPESELTIVTASDNMPVFVGIPL